MPHKPATNTRGKSKVSTKWLNNVMKSIGAASVDNFKEIAPNLSELGKGTAGAIRSIKDVTKGNNVSQVSKALSNNSTIKSVKKAFTNSLNDIKTGKLYNSERLTETMEESFGDFDFSDFEDANEDATVTFNYIDDGNRSSSNGSAVIADAIATSAESNIKAQKASVDAMISIASAGMMQSQEIAKETNMHLSNINNGITALVQFQQENTLKFYESAMAVFDRYAKTTEDDDRGKRSNGPDVFNGTRGIDAGKYKEYVKKQIKSVYKNSGAGSTLDMLTDDSMLDMMLANPVGGATKMILSAMVPNLVTNTVKGMEDAFTGFMPTMLAKLGDWRKSEEAGMKGALQRLIGNVFGIKVDAKKGFDLSGKVSKDAAVFDGVTRNSIVEIIPKHLREMSSYLKDIAEHFKIDTNKSKDNGEVFDIETGRYTKVKDVRSDIANQIKEGIEDAFNHSEFGEALRAGGSELVGKDAKTYEKMMSQFFQGLTRYEKAFTPDKMDIHDKNSDVNKIAEYIDVNNKHDEKILNILLNTIDLMKKNQVGVQHAAKAQMDAKVAFNNAIEDLNENYDTRNLLAAGITEDTNPWELVDVETGNKNSQKKRKELEERKKQEQKARDKYQMKHRTKGNAKTLAKKGLQNQDIIPDNETMSGRRQSAVKMADASTIPGMIANAGTHTKNGMFAIMNGDSKGAMKEFAAIFSDSMKTFWGSIKDNFLNPLKESIFGKKDENGYKQGGMFSAIQNKSKDIWHEMGSKIKGTDWTDADGNVHKGDKENSVLGKVSSVFKELGESVRYRLFGDKDKDEDGAEKKTGVIGGLVESLKLGLQGWKTTLFGSDDPEKSEKDMVEDFKKKAMDAIPSLGVGALAGLGTSLLSGGLLGAIVGGPMTGIVLGMGTSLVARSDKFKDYLFGPEVEDENGNKSRIGGLVSKKTQEMFKDPKLKKSVIGGAALGMAKNLILGSSGGFMGALVGGPFAGAILGSAVGFMKESQMFKDFMYGNEEKGIEGFKSKLSNNIKKAFGHKDDEDTKDFKKRMGMGVIGAGTGGLLGFMAGGPIVGALAGLALGVKSSGKKFNKWLFGEKDENGEKIKEGMVGKVGNWMHVEVFAPMKTKFLGIADDFKNTMKNKVFAKLSVMVEPLVSAFKGLTEKIKEGTKKAGGLLKKIMSPITNLAKKIVFDPLKKVVSGVTSLAYKSAKSMITFPVKILEVATRWVTSPFRKAAKKIGEAVDNVKEFTKETIKKAYSKTFGKLVNLVKAGFSWGKDKVKEKATNTGYKLIDTISGGRIKGKEGLNNLKKKLGFGGVGTALTDADIDYLKEKQENKKVQRDRKAMDKNRALAAKTLGYDVKYFDEKTMNAAIEKNKALKHKFKKNSAGEIGFEKDPKQVAAEMKQKAAETVQKLSDDDMLNAKSSDLDIQGRQLQQQTRSASLLERLVSFFTGDKPAFGVGKMNQSGKNDSDAEKDEKDKKDNEDKDNENEDEKSGAISKIDELKQKFEEAGGFFNYIKGKASETFANFKEKSKTAIDKVKGFFNRKGKARANGGDVNDGESYLVGDGGSDPKAAEIFTPKAKGKILSQKGNGIKVFVQGIASSVISKLKGTDGPSVDGATPNFGGGINGIKGRLKNFGMGIPFAGGSNNSSEDDSEADDIAVMKTKANSEADYDEEGNLIKENADTSDVDDIKDSSAKKEAIIDADNAADLANAKNEGSFESQQKKKEAEKEGEKDKEYKGLFGAIKDKIGEGNEQSKSHFLSWDNIFSKKGLITAGLLLLMAKFPGVWDTLKDIIGSIADGIGTAIGLTVKENNVNNGIGSQTDGGSRTDEVKKKGKNIKNGNILQLDEDGSTTSGTHEAVNLIGKTVINWKNRHNDSLTKTTKKTKKLMRGVEKVIKTPGRALDYIVNGPASDYKKFTRDKKKNHLKYDKKTGVYTDKYDRIVIDKDEWKQMVDEKGDDWAEQFKDYFYAPGDESFEIDPGKKKGKVSTWKDKKKKQIKKKVKNSKPGKAYDSIKTNLENKIDDVRTNAKTKVKNSKVGKRYEKTKKSLENAKKTGKEFVETVKQDTKKHLSNGADKLKQYGQDAASKLSERAKKNKGEGGLFKKIAGYVEGFFSSLISKLSEKSGKSGGGIKKALSKFSPKNIMNALKGRFPKIAGKLSGIMTRGITIGTATLGVSELVFAVGGAIDGATCAAKLFKVSKADVDWTMRLIGAAWGLVAGTTAGAIVDCILDFLEPWNVRVGLLSALYSFFAGDEKADNLKKSQDKFIKTYEADTGKKIKEQWETQKKAGIIGKDVSYEEFQEGVKEGKYKIDQESIEDYNTRVNAGLGDKITGGITKGAGYLYHRGKDFFVGKESYQDDKGNTYSKNDDGSWQVTDKSGKDLGSVNKDAIDTSKMKDTSSKGVIGKAKDLVGGAVNKAKDVVGGAVNGLKHFFFGSDDDEKSAKVDKNASKIVPGGSKAQGVKQKAQPKKLGGVVGAAMDMGAKFVNAVKNPRDTMMKISNGVHNFFTSEKEDIYRNPKDNSYYRANGKNWDLYNANGQKVNKKPIPAADVITAFQGGTLVKDTLTTRESGISKTIGAVKKGLNAAKDKVVGGIKTCWNGTKKMAANVFKGAKNLVGKAIGITKKVGKGIVNFFTSEKEDIYRNPKDNSYYRANGKNWDLYNANGQKVNKKPIPAADVITAFQGGTLVKDTLTTRESGISKTIGAVKKGLNAAKDKVVGAAKAGWNGIKKVGSWVWEHAKNNAKTLIGGVKKAGTAVKNFFMDSKEEIFRANDGTYYNAKGECFNKNDERLKNQDISQKELQARIKAGTLVKQEKVKKSGIKKLASNVWNGLTGGIKKGWNALKNFGTSVRDKAMDMGKTFVNGVKKAGTAVKNFFMDSKEEIFRANDGTYYNAKGECFNKNDERLKNQDISQKELQARIKAGTLVKQEKVKKSGIKKLASNVWNGLTGGIKKGWNALKNFGTSVRDKAMDMGKTFVNGVKKAGTAVKNFFMDSKEEIFRANDGTYYNAKGECFNKNDERLKNQDISQKELQARIKAGTLVKKEKVKKSGIKNLASKAWNGLTNGIKKGWEGLKSFAGGVKEKFGELKDGFVEFAKDPLGSVKSFFTSSKKQGYMSPEGDYYILNDDKTWTHYSATGGVLEDKIKDKDKIKEINSKIKNGTLVQTEITDKSGLQKIGEKFQNAVSEGWDKIKDGASSLWSGITNFFGGGGEEVSKTAGKITKQTAAIVPGGQNAAKKSMANQKTGGNGENEDDENGGNGEEVNGFSYFSQKDKKWSGNQYGSKDGKHSSSFGKSGCGPTAFAMVANQLKGDKIDPTTIADDAIKSGYRDETGTNANFIDYESQRYGLDATQQDAPSADYIIGQMDKGRPMILNGITTGSKNSAYTKSGHYVVAVGRDKNGNILINDPRGKSKSVPISPEDLAKETRIGWTFESPGYTIKKITKRIGGHGDKNTFTAEDVINIAKGEVGYSEKQTNSKLDDKKANAGTKNYNKYARDIGVGNGAPWCATFVNWCFIKAANGDKKKAKEVLCGATTQLCRDNQNIWKKAGRLDMKPQPGDVVFFMNGSSHTGLVIAVKGNTITTIEGNTSPNKFNRDGGCVAQKTYNYKTCHRISGFGHPKYDGSSTFNGQVGTADTSSDSNSSTTESSSSDNAITSFSDKFTNLFTQFSEKAMTGITTGKWDYNFNADGNTTDSSSSSDDTSDSTSGTSDGKIDTSISGNNESEQVWNFFTNNGFSPAATAGILGNMYQESGVNPKSIQGNGAGPAAGIFQWENYNNSKGTRFGGLLKKAKKRNKSWKDMGVQLEYALGEMQTADLNKRFAGKTGYLKHNPWNMIDTDKRHYSVKPVKGGFEGYKKMTDPTEATKVFEAAFERAGKPNFKRRIAYAKKMMNKYGDKVGGNGEGEGTDTYLNETSERYFNPQYKKSNTFDVDRTVHVNTTNKSGNNIMNVIDTKKLEEILEKAVSVLESIDKSTSSSQKELQNLRNASNNQMNNITNNNIYNTSNQSGTTPTGKNINDRNSKLAAMLARG